MFMISYPNHDDTLGWIFLLAFPAFNIPFVVFVYSCRINPSYSKLYDQGLTKTKCVPQILKESTINNKIAFFMCYFPSVIAAPMVAFVTIFLHNTQAIFLSSYPLYFWVNLCLLVVHFGKRSLETLFVHVYSRKVGNLLSFCIIWWWYLGIAISLSYAMVTDSDTKSNIDIESNLFLYIGIIIYIFGESLNGYSHWKLAESRKQ
eukprot:104794_1